MNPLRHITSADIEAFFEAVNPFREYHILTMGESEHYLGAVAIGFLLARGVDPRSNSEAVLQMGFGNMTTALRALL